MTWIIILALIVGAGGGSIFTITAILGRAVFRKSSCIYTPADEDNCSYISGCGRSFFNGTEDGEAVTSWMHHCPFCGKKAEESGGAQ